MRNSHAGEFDIVHEQPQVMASLGTRRIYDNGRYQVTLDWIVSAGVNVPETPEIIDVQYSCNNYAERKKRWCRQYKNKRFDQCQFLLSINCFADIVNDEKVGAMKSDSRNG